MERVFFKSLNASINYDKLLLDEAKYLASLETLKLNGFEEIPDCDLVPLIGMLLENIDEKYYDLFFNILKEQDCNNPTLYIYKSKKEIEENESLTFNQSIHFFQTNTIADVYLFFHEFSHLLVNRKESYKNDYSNKRYDELLPILSEFIIGNFLNNKEYIKLRINNTIFNAKSILVKEEIKKGNYNIEELFNKYNFSKKDIEFFKNDLLFKKSLDYEVEKRYLYGFIYGYYYSLNNPIENYKYLVEQYSNNRNILLPRIHLSDLEDPCLKI